MLEHLGIAWGNICYYLKVHPMTFEIRWSNPDDDIVIIDVGQFNEFSNTTLKFALGMTKKSPRHQISIFLHPFMKEERK